jgi:hypothetical protein
MHRKIYTPRGKAIIFRALKLDYLHLASLWQSVILRTLNLDYLHLPKFIAIRPVVLAS